MMLADRPIATKPTAGRSGGPLHMLVSTHRQKPRDCLTTRQPVLIVAGRLRRCALTTHAVAVGTLGGMMPVEGGEALDG